MINNDTRCSGWIKIFDKTVLHTNYIKHALISLMACCVVLCVVLPLFLTCLVCILRKQVCKYVYNVSMQGHRYSQVAGKDERPEKQWGKTAWLLWFCAKTYCFAKTTASQTCLNHQHKWLQHYTEVTDCKSNDQCINFNSAAAPCTKMPHL